MRFPDGEEVGGSATAARSDGSGGRTEILQAVYIAVKVRALRDITPIIPPPTLPPIHTTRNVHINY